MKILVLGHKGMLGHMVYKYLSTKSNCELTITDSRWPSEKFKKKILDFNGDFVVNCIGAIHQKTNNFKVNTELPIWLDELDKNFKIIHPGTDCEIDDDDYGDSKRISTEYLMKNNKNTKIIKTSIIGHELDSKYSLLEWFLNSDSEVFGYSQAYWNGNTTLQWSKICYNLMVDWDNYEKLNIPSTECISKYELLEKIKDVYDKDNVFIRKNSDVKVNKCLNGNINVPEIKEQLIQMREFYK